MAFATITPSVDATLDGTAGLGGTGKTKESLHATVLAGVGWSQTEQPSARFLGLPT